MISEEKHPALRLLRLVLGLRSVPPGRTRLLVATVYGLACHLIFGAAVAAMIVAMFFGMSESLGQLSGTWSYLANAALLLQFPLTHSLLLSRRGRSFLSKLAPFGYGPALSTTTYAVIASLQLLLLFAFWSPSGIVWWQAEGAVFWLLCGLYGFSWLLLIKASYDAGAEVQSGALGWMSLAQNIRPVFPDMPETGLFRLIRQPIYVSFALTTWTVPVWTPDQLVVALVLSAYCLAAPVLKERRFEGQFGARFRAYQARVPYMLPKMSRRPDQ
ncbi:isoprenylcysteine carboxylmethyltransferase family protein [Roseibium denhamense]|nr:isoprenylcysteine carboxylmethyltransferase family protein [Roseibium denhamense]